MPFSAELGMNVYDPHEAQRLAAPAAEEAAQSFDKARTQADKARQLLARNVAMSNMKIRAQELYSHMEQTPENLNLAQRQAFLENASGILGGEAGAGNVIEHLLQSDEAQLIKQKAAQALDDKRTENIDLRRQIFEGQQATKAKEQEINLLKIGQTQADKAAQRDLQAARDENTRLDRETQRELSAEREKGRNERAKAALNLKAASDPEIKAIDQSIASATQTLAAKQASPKWHWLTDEAGTKKAIEDLKSARTKRLKELGVDTGPASESAGDNTQPDQTTKRLKWTPDGFVPAQ